MAGQDLQILRKRYSVRLLLSQLEVEQRQRADPALCSDQVEISGIRKSGLPSIDPQ